MTRRETAASAHQFDDAGDRAAGEHDRCQSQGQQRYYDTLAANKAMNEQAYSATMARLNNIQALMRQSNMTQDPARRQICRTGWLRKRRWSQMTRRACSSPRSYRKQSSSLPNSSANANSKTLFLEVLVANKALSRPSSVCLSRSQATSAISRGTGINTICRKKPRTGANWRSRLSSWVRLQKSLNRKKRRSSVRREKLTRKRLRKPSRSSA